MAFDWYSKAIDVDSWDSEVQCRLGDMYLLGEGVERDYPIAMNKYTEDMPEGNPTAQGRVGWFYYYGLGVEKDYKVAEELFRTAAESGEPFAQFGLGNCYFYGNGVSRDISKAAMWYSASIAGGCDFAEKELAKRGWKGSDVILMMSLDKSDDIMVGDTLVASLKLLKKPEKEISGIKFVKPVVFEGCRFENIFVTDKPEYKSERFGGEMYDATVLSTYLLIPEESGNSISHNYIDLECTFKSQNTNDKVRCSMPPHNYLVVDPEMFFLIRR